MEHHLKVNPGSKSEINDGKVLMIGSPDEALDYATLNNTIHGFYTMRDIEITAIECIVTEAMVCSGTAGVASLIGDGTVYATVTAVDNEAINSHMSGVISAGVGAACVPKGTMLYMKTTTANDEGSSDAGQGFFIVEYK